MKEFLPVLSVLLLGTAAYARDHNYWSYEGLTRAADMIVIATPVFVHDTSDSTNFPSIADYGPSGRRLIPAIGVETTFKTLSVLKANTNTATFVFHHLRVADNMRRPDGPETVAFDPSEKKQFLLFLKREPDGRYVALTGQTDPVYSVKEVTDLGMLPVRP